MCSLRKLSILVCASILFTCVYSDELAAPVDPPPPAAASTIPGLPADFSLPPGAAAQLLPLLGLGGAGFTKNFALNAGAGAGFGVPPPVPPIDAGVPPPPPPPGGPSLAGAFPFPAPLFFPGYVPQSWVGSATSAIGDLLFPVAIFAFVIVGIWTVVQFLLGILVPLVAGKKMVKDELLFGKKFLRSVDRLDEITEAVLPVIENEPCHPKAACKAGNLIHNMVGLKHYKEYENLWETNLHNLVPNQHSGTENLDNSEHDEITNKEFQKALKSGNEDCSHLTC